MAGLQSHTRERDHSRRRVAARGAASHRRSDRTRGEGPSRQDHRTGQPRRDRAHGAAALPDHLARPLSRTRDPAGLGQRGQRVAGRHPRAVRQSLRRSAPSMNLHGWKNLRPYTGRLLALALLAVVEVALRVALPWPMTVVVDQALGNRPPTAWLVSLAGPSRESWLAFAVVTGVLLQLAHQAVLMGHTRIHTVTGHLLTRDLRQRLFLHLQALSLRHHSKLPVGEAVYRLQWDAVFLDQLLVRGVLPLMFSAATLIVMFTILVNINVQLALVSLSVVPFLFLWIRWHSHRIRPTADRTLVLESRLTARLHESFSAIRLVKSFAREPYEGLRFAAAASDAMQARVTLTGREAWFSLIVGNLIVLGTALVLLFGGLQVLG